MVNGLVLFCDWVPPRTHRVHVTGGAGVLEADVVARGPTLDGGLELEVYRGRFTTTAHYKNKENQHSRLIEKELFSGTQ